MRILAIDPDSTHPAFCVGSDGEICEVWGGGSSKSSPAPTYRMLEECVTRHAPDLVVSEEPGNYLAPGVTVLALRGLFRIRYMVEALCEAHGIPFVAVTPSTWQSWLCPGVPRKKGEMKKAYTSRVRSEYSRAHSANEDRCAAIGIYLWAHGNLSIAMTIDGEST